MMMDNKQVRIVSLQYSAEIVAVALLMIEGHCSPEELQAVDRNERRLRDQFLPQSLLTHCGIKSAFDFQYLRIMRVAVHPQHQSRGLGSVFLQKLKVFAKAQSMDFLGTSFGVNEILLNFWLMAGYKFARLGFTQDKASGEYSALLLQSLNESADAQLKKINGEFYRSFDYLLQQEYPGLPAKVIALVLQQSPEWQQSELSAADIACIEDFAAKRRLYSACAYSLHLWLLAHLKTQRTAEVWPLISKILQKKSNTELCRIYGFSGKKAINRYLVNYVKEHVKLPSLSE